MQERARQLRRGTIGCPQHRVTHLTAGGHSIMHACTASLPSTFGPRQEMLLP